MTFSDAVRQCINKYATMKGRAPRSEYWWFVVFNTIVLLGMSIMFYFIGMLACGRGCAILYANIGYIIACFVLFCPSLCVCIRRLHDTGHSGGWFFISFVPFIGSFWLLFLLLQDSDEENVYGLPVY